MPIADLMQGLRELRDAHEDYELAELYYEGRNEELFATPQLARALRAYEARYRLRFARVPVDEVVNRLEIAAVTIVDDEPAAENDGDPAAGEDEDLSQRLQDDVRDRNDMEIEEDLIHLKTCMFGDAYLIASPIEDFDPGTGDTFRRIELFYNSPFETRVVYDRSGRHKQFAVKFWEEQDDFGQDFLRATLFYVDSMEEWATRPGSKGDQERDWVPWGPGSPKLDEAGNPVVLPVLHPVTKRQEIDPETGQPMETEDIEAGVYYHDYGDIPVFHFRTGRPYGRPEHEAAYGPQDMIDKLTITQMATVDFQGFPQRFFLQDPQATQDAADADWGGDDGDDASAITETIPEPKLEAGPGKAWWIEGAKAAGQFDVANADAFLKPLERYVRAMSTVTHTPFHLFDPTGQPGAGEGRRAAESGQTKKVRRRQRQFGATWRETYAFCMWWLTGQDVSDRLEIRWLPAESIDPAEAWDLAGKKKVVGLPLVQVFKEHGYSPDQIVEFLALALEERKEQIELQREAFNASLQGNRDDRPNRPNPDTGDPGGGGGNLPGGGSA
jgi:hypothetical protein